MPKEHHLIQRLCHINAARHAWLDRQKDPNVALMLYHTTIRTRLKETIKEHMAYNAMCRARGYVCV
jgi:hypothetical protein